MQMSDKYIMYIYITRKLAFMKQVHKKTIYQIWKGSFLQSIYIFHSFEVVCDNVRIKWLAILMS
jgi:hypothetical protein